MHIRLGRPPDLPNLLDLEAACFEPERCDSPKVIAHSLQSPHQEVWLALEKDRLAGALALRFHPRTCRIHSIAVHPSAQGKGLGKRLLELARTRAATRATARINLEADARNRKLLEWYQFHGYRKCLRLPHYYARGWHAWRLTRKIQPSSLVPRP